MVSVKGGCLDGLDWTTAIHIWTKSAMVPIPEGSECYSEEPTDSEYSGPQEALDQPTDVPGSVLMGSGGVLPQPLPTEEVSELNHTKKGLCELSTYYGHVAH